jgi:hypothetical protein
MYQHQFATGLQLASTLGWVPGTSSTDSTSASSTDPTQGHTVLQVHTRGVQTTPQLQPSVLLRSSSHGLPGLHQRDPLQRLGSCDAGTTGGAAGPHNPTSTTSTATVHSSSSYSSSSSRGGHLGSLIPPPPTHLQQQQQQHQQHQQHGAEPLVLPLRSECRQRIPGTASAVATPLVAAACAGSQTPPATNVVPSGNSHSGDMSDEPVCRICLEPVTAKEVAQGQGLVLGCR